MTVEHGSSLDSTETAIDSVETPPAGEDGDHPFGDLHASAGWPRSSDGSAGVRLGGVQ